MTAVRGLLRVLAGAGVAAAALGVGSTALAAGDDSGIAISGVETGDYPRVSAVVAAPPGPAGAAYTPDMFEVREGSTKVDASVHRIPTGNLQVMLLLDTSGSMRGEPLQRQKEAAKAFLAQMPPEVEVGAIGYADAPNLVAGPTTDRDVVAWGIGPLEAAGDTALYDALLFAGAQFDPAAQRRVIVLLTDGEDNASTTTLAAATTQVAHDVPIYVIELLTERSDRNTLEWLARAGGGSVSVATDPSALTDLYRQIAGAITNQYRVTYRSEGHGAQRLTVRVRSAAGTSIATTRIDLPATPRPAPTPPTTTTPPTTAPPTTVPATTVPATTVPPTTTTATTVPATTAPPTTAPAVAAPPTTTPRSSAGGGDETTTVPPTALLAGGAAAIFLSLLLLAWVALSGDGGRAAVRAGLGLVDTSASEAGMSRLKDNMSAGVDRMLEKRGKSRSVATALEVAGISLRPGEFVLLVAVATAVAALVATTMFGLLGGLLTVVLAPLATRMVLNMRVSRRRAAFAELLPENLQLLTSGLKSGYGLAAALDNVAQEAAEPARGEFRRVVLETRVGRDLSEALTALAERMASEDFEWVVGAIDINREIGGDLAQTLDNVGETIRERQFLGRQVKALTAEGRLSAYLLTGIPIFLGGAMSVINPGYLEPMFTGVGWVLTGTCIGLLSVAWLWMKKLIRVDL